MAEPSALDDLLRSLSQRRVFDESVYSGVHAVAEALAAANKACEALAAGVQTQGTAQGVAVNADALESLTQAKASLATSSEHLVDAYNALMQREP